MRSDYPRRSCCLRHLGGRLWPLPYIEDVQGPTPRSIAHDRGMEVAVHGDLEPVTAESQATAINPAKEDAALLAAQINPKGTLLSGSHLGASSSQPLCYEGLSSEEKRSVRNRNDPPPNLVFSSASGPIAQGRLPGRPPQMFHPEFGRSGRAQHLQDRQPSPHVMRNLG